MFFIKYSFEETQLEYMGGGWRSKAQLNTPLLNKRKINKKINESSVHCKNTVGSKAQPKSHIVKCSFCFLHRLEAGGALMACAGKEEGVALLVWACPPECPWPQGN